MMPFSKAIVYMNKSYFLLLYMYLKGIAPLFLFETKKFLIFVRKEGVCFSFVLN